MSPMLFNAVIDMVSDIDRSIGVTGGEKSAVKCNYIAFADDLRELRKRQWIVNPEPYLKLQDEDIRALSIVDTYKYLGVQIGPRV